jgi:integrase
MRATAARALEFLILTAARTGEVLGARWGEIDLAEKVWIVPAQRMKGGREHRVPLAAERLKSSPRRRRFARANSFSLARGPGSRWAPRRCGTCCAAWGARVTAHGFRSTFRDWAAERTTFPAEIAEMALAHAVGDKVEAAYRRGDLFQKRRQLAEAWAKYCHAPAASGAAVIALRGRRASP